LLSIIVLSIDQYLVDPNVKMILSGSHLGTLEDAIFY